MIEVPVRRARVVVTVAVIDDCDADLVLSRVWRLSCGYALASVDQTTNVLMHRLILDAPPGLVTDHINGNKLDNRRENLRLGTQAMNCQNLPARAQGTSPYRGVSWRTEKNRWAAQCRFNNKVHHLGYFHDELEAARVAAEFRRQHMPFANPARDVRTPIETNERNAA